MTRTAVRVTRSAVRRAGARARAKLLSCALLFCALVCLWSPAKAPCEALVKGVSAGEVVPLVEVVGSVSRAEVKFERVKVTVVVMMTVHCHRRGRQHKRKCNRSNQSEFCHGRSPFTADIGAFFAIPIKLRFRNFKWA